MSGNPPTADVGDADVMGQTAGGRSCFLMSCTTGFTAGQGPYEIELIQNIEFTMVEAHSVLFGTNKVAADVFARKVAAEI